MTKQELQRKLRANYNRDTWKGVLLEMFPEANLFAQDRPTRFTREEQRNLANHIVQFGEVDLDGDTLIFLEVELKPDSVQLTRNRVGLRKLVDNEVIAGLTDGALISYYQPETDEWRITFYSERYGWDEDGNTIKEETHPKRYTYVVGPSESCKTAAGQLIKVVQKGSENTLEHVLKAFSVQKVSKEFFKEYKEQYDKFVGYLTGKIWTKSGVKEVGDRISQFQFYFKATTDHEKEARDFVKKLLGRIVFLYFVQKKQWLGADSTEFKDGKPDFIYDLFKQVPDGEKDQFYSQWLTKLFFDTLNRDNDHAFDMPDGSTVYIPFLNGGLFEKDETDHNTESLPLPGELFSNPEDTESPNTRGFLDFLSAYNFTIHEDSPGDHTIAVDPEMLGHIFENLLEDNKDKGAYYTPKPIVHYMCQESLIEYLLTELTTEGTEDSEKEELREHLEDLIKKQEAGELVGFTEPILKSLKEVKVCDPAIGSGAFPMGILQEIYQAVETLHHLSPDNVQAIWELPDDDWHPAEVKKQIIQNSIYGVDIEKGAVDIARLRFWLSLIVDEEKPTALPNLDYKIVVGDSLVSKFEGEPLEIEWDLEDSQSNMFGHEEFLKRQKLLKDITETQRQYFKAGSDKKEELALKVRNQKIDLLINQLSLMIQTKGEEKKPTGSGKKINERMNRWVDTQRWKQLIKTLKDLRDNPKNPFQHFDWKLDFPEILNEQFTDDTGFDIVIANPPYVDIKGLNKEQVNLLFEKFSTTENRINLYSIFIEKGWALGNSKCVLTFINPNSILLNSSYTKIRKHIVEYVKKILKLPDNIFQNAIVETIVLILSGKNNDDNIFGAFYKNDQEIDFGSLEYQIFDRKKWQEDEIKKFNIFISPEATQVIDKIESLDTEPFEKYCDFSLGITPYDSYKGHSQKQIKTKAFHSDTKKGQDYVPLISGRNVQKYIVSDEIREYLKYGDWLGAPRKRKFFTKPRVIVRQIISGDPPSIYAGYTEQDLYHTQIGFAILSKDDSVHPKYICGLLNSELINFYHSAKFLDPEKNTFQKILIQNCKQFPLITNSDYASEIIDLVDQILTQKEANSDADSTALEKQIDTMVYKLYNLTWEEVQVVDPEFGLSEEEYEDFEVDANQ